jgi:hypothetical protein
MTFPGYRKPDANVIIGVASNIRAGGNPPYSVEDFLSSYPQFGTATPILPETEGLPVVPIPIIQIYIDLAQESIQQARYRSAWKIAMGLFIAHFCQMWLQSSVSVDAGKDAIIGAGETVGITTSESVDGVSYSVDASAILQDLDGFASWKTTTFGVQLSTFARMYGKGGMMIP